MHHVVFVSNNKSVCEKPKLLGHDEVLVRYVYGETTCEICMSLIMAHNDKYNRYDLAFTLPENLPKKPAATYHWPEFQHGAVVASIVWVGLLVLLYLMYTGR